MINKPDLRTGTRLNSLIRAVTLVLVAVLLAWSSARYSYEADWTRHGRHTLSAASKQLLAKLDGELEITAYAGEQEELRGVIRKFIGRYQRIKADIILHFVNPDAVPDQTRSLGIGINGEMVVRYQERREHVHSTREEEFTNALQRLLRGSEKWLAFIEGHGDRNPLGQANHDIGEWAEKLRSRGFKFQPLNLAQTPAIPDNTAVLVIAGPLVPFLPGEVEQILNYLAAGGNLLWLGEPGDLYGLEAVADYLGIDFPTGTVIDSASRLFGIDDPTITLITDKLYGDHAAVDQFNYTTLFPKTTAISIDSNSQWKATPLYSTGKHAWLETGPLKGKVAFTEDEDLPGPLAIAISLERKLERQKEGKMVTRQQRIIVTGDGDFLSNNYIGNSGNMELGIRLINWLSGDDDFISIPAGIAGDTQLNLSPLASGFIGLGFLIILPLGLLGSGVLVWWRRKNL